MTAGVDRSQRLRWTFRGVVVVTVLPIIVAAIHNALTGWQPTRDAAVTAVRVRDVFSAHPPLVGLAAFPGAEGDTLYSYPGAMQIQLLAVPVKVLGVTWGLLLGMAALNTLFVVAALWLVRRRVGERWAIVAALFVASLIWTTGTQILVDPTPVEMVILPVFALLVAGWSVADGDGPALLVGAFIANYLVLSHPEFVVLVPFVAVYALGVRAWRRHRTRSGPGSSDGSRPTARRWMIAASALTVVCWIPPLVEQFSPSGGNLTKIVQSAFSGGVDARQSANLAPTFTGALGTVVSVTAVPPAWLPPHFTHPPFDAHGGGTPFVVGLLSAVVLWGLLAWAGWRAHRRADTTTMSAIGAGLVGWFAYLVTAARNPGILGFDQRYFYGLWPLAAYLWFVAALGAYRAWPRRGLLGRLGPRVTLAARAGVVVLALVALPASDHRLIVTAQEVPTAGSVRDDVATFYRGTADAGPVRVTAMGSTTRYLAPALLGLQDAGVPFRVVDPFLVQQYGDARDATRHHDATRALTISPEPLGDRAGTLIGTVGPASSGIDDAGFEADDARMLAWASGPDRLDIDSDVGPPTPALILARVAAGTLAGSDCTGRCLIDDRTFLELLAVLGQPQIEQPLFDVPGMDRDDQIAWAAEKLARRPAVYLYERKLPPG